jgi:hypothetical protein
MDRASCSSGLKQTEARPAKSAALRRGRGSCEWRTGERRLRETCGGAHRRSGRTEAAGFWRTADGGDGRLGASHWRQYSGGGEGSRTRLGTRRDDKGGPPVRGGKWKMGRRPKKAAQKRTWTIILYSFPSSALRVVRSWTIILYSFPSSALRFVRPFRTTRSSRRRRLVGVGAAAADRGSDGGGSGERGRRRCLWALMDLINLPYLAHESQIGAPVGRGSERRHCFGCCYGLD